MKRLHLGLLALATGVIYSWPNWWWLLTLPGYSLVRGFALSDNDPVPYAAALNASARGWPLTAPYLRFYENRSLLDAPALSNWLTNLLLGGLVRLTGSLEAMAAVALLLSGAATFLLLYALARRLDLRPKPALAASLLICFRYPFYTPWVAAARQWVETRGQLEPQNFLSLLFPGMVNANQLYPFTRWPVPGLMFWGFLLALILLFSLVRRLAAAPGGPFPTRPVALAGLALGLTAYLYFYIWAYLAALAVTLAALALLARRARAASALAAVGLGALLLAGPVAAVGIANRALQVELGGRRPLLSLRTKSWRLPDSWGEIMAVHGTLALAVGLTSAAARPSSAAAAGGRFRHRLAAGWEPGPSGGLWLFALHLTVVLLALLETAGVRLEAWHTSEYLLDSLAPLTAAWIAVRWAQFGAAGPPAGPAAGIAWRGWALWLAICVAGVGALWAAGQLGLEVALSVALGLGVLAPAVGRLARLRPGAGLLVAIGLVPIAWYYYHRTVNEVSWVALLPLAAGLALWRPAWLGRAAWAFAGLNLLAAAALQGWVRPLLARDFFSLPPGYSAALNWLDQHAPPDSVVASNGWMSDYLIRSYTPALTLSGPDWWSAAGIAEMRQRQEVRSAIFQVPPQTMEQLIAHRLEAAGEFKANVNQRWIGGPAMDELSERQGTFRYDPAEYAAYYARPLASLLGQYRVDYIWIGPWERALGQRDFAASPELALVFDNEAYQIYQVRRAP